MIFNDENYLLKDIYAHGNLSSVLELAELYEEQNRFDDAFNIINYAATKNFSPAIRRLGYYYEKGIGVEVDLKHAYDLYNTASEMGDGLASYNLALLLHNGAGVEKNDKLAIELLDKSRKQGHTKSLFFLSIIYKEVDPVRAFTLARELEHAGENEAYILLGQYYLHGVGVEQSYEHAYQCFLKGTEENVVECYYFVGLMLTKGEGVDKNLGMAMHYFQRGAFLGDVKCMLNLSVFYEKGIYTAVDMESCEYWLNKASEKGSQKAKDRLKELGF